MSQRSEEIPASVRLDGAALKRVREEKYLTQLYVSKVVGVTTDTVSRWENNRYPTMRRDNALKLAEALEVPLAELLFRPPAAEPSALPEKRPIPLVLPALFALLLAVLLGLFVWFNMSQPLPAAITAERLLPPHAPPGGDLPVRITLTRRSEEGGFILREYLPKGWQLLQADPPPSSLDHQSGMVRWIIKAGDSRERIAYLVRVAGDAVPGSHGAFQGEVIAGAERNPPLPVHGDSRVVVARALWADLDADGRIDDAEMLQASHAIDELGGVKIDWQELERLWSAGGYRWDEAGKGFLPVSPDADRAPPRQ